MDCPCRSSSHVQKQILNSKKMFIKQTKKKKDSSIKMEGLDVKLTTTTDFVQNTENVNLTLKFVFHQSTQGVLYDTNFVEVIVPKMKQVIAETLDEFDALHTLRQLRFTPPTLLTTSQTTTNTHCHDEPRPAPIPPVENRFGQLRRVSFPHHFQDVTCGLCNAAFVQNEFYRTAICKHTFHKRCIDRWAITCPTTCPVCNNNTSP